MGESVSKLICRAQIAGDSCSYVAKSYIYGDTDGVKTRQDIQNHVIAETFAQHWRQYVRTLTGVDEEWLTNLSRLHFTSKSLVVSKACEGLKVYYNFEDKIYGNMKHFYITQTSDAENRPSDMEEDIISAFQHFTYEKSGQRLLVACVQGKIAGITFLYMLSIHFI